jgi:hypothetical protein
MRVPATWDKLSSSTRRQSNIRNESIMAQSLVQINFKLTVSGAEYEQAVAPLAQTVADVDGLQWKIWLLNEHEHEAGGVYLFADLASADAFLESSLVAQVKSAPILSDFRTAQFDLIDNLTTITRGPVAETMRAE